MLNLFKIKAKSLPTKFENPIIYGILENLQSLTENAINTFFKEDSFQQVKERVIIGTLPTGEINARAILTPNKNHYLIIFDSEIFNFANLLSKSIAYAMKPELAMGMMVLSMNIPDIEERLAEDESVLRRFSEPIISFILTGRVLTAPYILKHPFSMMAKKLLDSMELFVMGHEYSHMILGHLNENNLCASALPSLQKNTEFHKSWIQEFEADIKGVQIMSAACQSQGYHFLESFLGVDFFFICSMLLERGINVLKTGEDELWKFDETEFSSTHPPILFRLNYIHQALKNKFDAKIYEGIMNMNRNIIGVVETLWEIALLPRLKELHKQGVKPNMIWEELQKRHS